MSRRKNMTELPPQEERPSHGSRSPMPFTVSEAVYADPLESTEAQFPVDRNPVEVIEDEEPPIEREEVKADAWSAAEREPGDPQTIERPEADELNVEQQVVHPEVAKPTGSDAVQRTQAPEIPQDQQVEPSGGTSPDAPDAALPEADVASGNLFRSDDTGVTGDFDDVQGEDSDLSREPEIGVASAEEVKTSDLYLLSGVGPGLVWMLEQCGVHSLAQFAESDPETLKRRLGLVGEILDIGALVRHAQNIEAKRSYVP